MTSNKNIFEKVVNFSRIYTTTKSTQHDKQKDKNTRKHNKLTIMLSDRTKIDNPQLIPKTTTTIYNNNNNNDDHTNRDVVWVNKRYIPIELRSTAPVPRHKFLNNPTTTRRNGHEVEWMKPIIDSPVTCYKRGIGRDFFTQMEFSEILLKRTPIGAKISVST